MNKKFCFGVVLTAALSVGALVATALAFNRSNSKVTRVEGDVYTLTLDSTNAPSDMASMQGLVTNKVVQTAKGNPIKVNYSIAKNDGSGHVVLGNHGQMYTTADSSTHKNKISSIQSIKVNFTTDDVLKLRTSSRNDGLGWTDEVELTSGDTVDLPNHPYYFSLSAGDAYATITSIEIKYECVDNNGLYLSNLSGTYTGLGNDGFVYKLTLDGGNAALESLTRDTKVNFDGTFALTEGSNGAIVMNVGGQDVTYNVAISNDNHKLQYVSKSGATAAYVPEIDFYRVYTVENFDEYAIQGYGYDNKDGKQWYQTTGLRSSFYSQYNGADTASFNLMGNNDYLNLTGEYKHGESGKSAAIKAMNTNFMRYVQNKVYYGEPTSIGKGNYLSFWAMGVAQDVTLDVYAYKYDGVTRLKENAALFNPDNFATGNVTVPAGSPWTQYFIELDNSIEYKGFGVRARKTASGTVYMPIDDVQIYTHNPWATPAIPVSSVSLDKDAAEVWTSRSFVLTPTISPANATNKNVTWESSNTSIATVDNGVVTGVSVGDATITVKTEDGNKTATCAVSVTALPTFLSGQFLGEVSVNLMGDKTFPVMIATGDQGQLELCFNGRNTGFTAYTNNGTTFSVTSKNEVSFAAAPGSSTMITVNAGTLSGDIVDGTFKNCSVTGATYKVGNGSASALTPTNNGHIDFVKQTAFADSCDGNTETLQATYNRWYRAWPAQGKPANAWTLDSGNWNRVYSETTKRVDGTGSMMFRGYSSGEALLTLKNELPSEARKAFNNVSFWVYNDGSSARSIYYWVLREAKANPITLDTTAGDAQIGNKSIPVGEWTFVSCGFDCDDEKPLFNIGLFISGAGEKDFYFDNICLYHY